MTKHKLLQAAALTLLLFTTTFAQATDSKQPELKVVGTAHLDTQWRWTIQNTINDFVPLTFRENFKLMDIYPDYVFSFEGSFRYKLFREYYPDEYAKLKKYVDSGQWRVTGSWVDAVDVNIPSFESLVRHNLYGNGFYKKEFGKTSRDIFLPDCFGFGYALPSIAAHCGLKSFTTQKLTWGSAVGVPFDIGLWQGVDGSRIIACLDAGNYTGKIKGDLSRDTTWLRKIAKSGETTGLHAGYTYFGTGDTGGSPESLSVDWLQKSIKSDGPIKVTSIGADDLVDLVNSADQSKLPVYNGELLMTRHGVGCYTSQAAMKRWNRKNELLADAAERASVIAHLTAGVPYPADYLRDTWERFLWHQFHDDLTGTSIPEAYEFSWNDEILCQNRFAGALENAVASSAPLLDTRVEGTPLLVFNPVARERQDLIHGRVLIPGDPPYVRVYSPEGNEVPSQRAVKGYFSSLPTFMFIDSTLPLSYSVYDVRASQTPCDLATDLQVTPASIENSRYKLALNSNGDILSIFDKKLQRELLTAPIQYQLLFDKPRQWPAWEIQYEDIILPPRAVLNSPVEVKIIEQGPVRAAIQVVRKTDVSTFTTIISMTSNSDRIEFKNEIDWYEKETLLKVAFPLTCANDSVTYDLGLGAIKRGLNTKQKYEVPGHQWADMTDPSGEYGVAILNDCKYGWDHPEAGVLRLTLIHTPGVFDNWNWVGDEKSQDMGHHEFTFAICAHKGDWSESDIPEQAARLNQPIVSFLPGNQSGTLGRKFSFLNINAESSGDNVFVNAVKMSEAGDELIVRVKETKGKTANAAKINFAFPIESAREVNGFEDPVEAATISGSALEFSLTPYQPKAFAVKLKTNAADDLPAVKWLPVALPYNLDAISLDSDRKDGNIDGKGNSLAGELIPDTLTYRNLHFVMGPKRAGELNAISCNGQKIKFPKGDFKMLHILACAADGPVSDGAKIGDREKYIEVQGYAEPIAQWNSRLVTGRLIEEPAGIAPGYINRQPVAWYGSHRHSAEGRNEAYRFTYLFHSEMWLHEDAKSIQLPDNPSIKILAMTVADDELGVGHSPIALYDELEGKLVRINSDSANFLGAATVTMTSPNLGTKIHFALDGSQPTSRSPVYSEPLSIAATTTVKASALGLNDKSGFVTSVTYRQLVPHDGSAVGDLKSGLSAAYYEGEWQKLPAFDSLKAKESYIADSISLPTVARAEDFGLTFAGYFLAPAEGLYEFAISSDDGSKVFVGDSLVVDNDGLHGGGDVVGQIALKAGYHRLYIPMFQCKGGRELDVHVSGPGLARERLRANRLFH